VPSPLGPSYLHHPAIYSPSRSAPRTYSSLKRPTVADLSKGQLTFVKKVTNPSSLVTSRSPGLLENRYIQVFINYWYHNQQYKMGIGNYHQTLNLINPQVTYTLPTNSHTDISFLNKVQSITTSKILKGITKPFLTLETLKYPDLSLFLTFPSKVSNLRP